MPKLRRIRNLWKSFIKVPLHKRCGFRRPDVFLTSMMAGDKTVDDLFDYIAGQGFDVGGMDLMGHFFRWAADKQHVKVVLPVRSAESWAKSWQMIEPGLDVLFGRPFSFSSRVRQLEPFVRDCMNVSGVSNSDKSLEVRPTPISIKLCFSARNCDQ